MEGTILREILRNCRERGDLPVCHWVGRQCEVEETLTYRELGEQSRELAEELLLSLQLQRGDRVVLCYSQGLEFFVSFLACLRAGIIAVPVHPHSTVCDGGSVDVLEHIVKDCSAKCVLTNDHYIENTPSYMMTQGALEKVQEQREDIQKIMESIHIRQGSPSFVHQLRALLEQIDAFLRRINKTAGVSWHSTTIIAKQDKTQQNPTVPYLDRAKPTDLALLQYTRNRESAPDGEMHTHSSLLRNLKVLGDFTQSDHGSSAVWPLPLLYRTGLLSYYLLVPFSGGRGYFMSEETLSTLSTHTECVCRERDRSLCKEKLLSGTLQVIHQWSPSTSGNRAAVKPEKPRPKPHPPTTTPTVEGVQTPTGQAVFTQPVALTLQRMLTDLESIGALAREVVAHQERGRGEGSYYTVPSTEELGSYSKEKLKSVQYFTVGRCGYGRVEFFGAIDISSVDLSSQLVEIERESIRVCAGSKTSLNRPALVYLDGHTTQGGGGGGGGEERVKKVLESLGESASLVHSDATTGEIVIKTELC